LFREAVKETSVDLGRPLEIGIRPWVEAKVKNVSDYAL